MIINFSSYKGGVGKTSLATNAAVHFNAALLDLDGLKSSSNFAKIRAANGKEIDCFTATTTEEIKEIISSYRDKILVVDSGGYDSDTNRLAMIASDILITPVSPSLVEIAALQQYKKVLQQIGEEYKQKFRANVIINRADIRSKSDVIALQSFVKTDENFDLYQTIIHDRVDFKRAYASGMSAIELDEESKASFELIRFFKEIEKDF